jgi:ABC-type molybdate transport system substrate-binding protein
VRVLEIPASANVRAEYAIGVVLRGVRSPRARRFVEFVLGSAGHEVLARHGLDR